MSTDEPIDRLRGELTGVVAMLVTGIWLVAMFADQSWWLPFMLVGYVVIVPLTAILTGESDRETEEADRDGHGQAETSEQADALARLRERYARGELTDEAFERKVERLLETETLADADDLLGEERSRRESATDRSSDGDPEPDRELSDE